MNSLWIYCIQLVVTAGVTLAIVVWFRPYLHSMLVDLCGTSERAKFWGMFSYILLLGLPLLFSLGYNPLKSVAETQFFDIARQIRTNLLGFLFAWIGIGGVILFFTLVAPRKAIK